MMYECVVDKNTIYSIIGNEMKALRDHGVRIESNGGCFYYEDY